MYRKQSFQEKWMASPKHAGSHVHTYTDWEHIPQIHIFCVCVCVVQKEALFVLIYFYVLILRFDVPLSIGPIRFLHSQWWR